MKILMLSNQSRSMSIFWKILIKLMKDHGAEVICCTPEGDSASDAQLEALGAQTIHYELDRKGLNPLKDIQTCHQLYKIFKIHKPDLIFATTIKPVIYGCLAAKFAGIKNIYATITGLGYAFEADTPLKKIINRISVFLYRASLKNAGAIFFQNHDDSELFLKDGIINQNYRILFARGTGVDTSHFALAPLPPIEKAQPIYFLLIARLLEAKGLREYHQAAHKVRQIYPNAHFQLLGPPEEGRGSISLAEIASWAPDVEYLGQAQDVRPYIANSHVVVLPSWREGTPTAVMEAMSMGRPCVVTDAPGCREVVKNGGNGYLAKVRDAESLAEAMRKFLDDPKLIQKMGEKSRELAVSQFDAHKVAQGILTAMTGENHD